VLRLRLRDGPCANTRIKSTRLDPIDSIGWLLSITVGHKLPNRILHAQELHVQFISRSVLPSQALEAPGLQDEEGKKLEETGTKAGAIISTSERPLAGASEYRLDT